MSKLTLASITNIQTAQTTVNANNALVTQALENTLSRDGTTPNTMLADFDLNGHKILNVGTPTSATDVARLVDITAAGGSVGVTPTGVIGLTNIPGVLTTCPRSDSSPALSQAIAPSWTGIHNFTLRTQFADGTVSLPGIALGSEITTGFYKLASGQLGISLAGTTAGAFAQGVFTPTWVGFSVPPTGNMNYVKIGKLVFLWNVAGFSGTSNSTSFQMGSVPAIITPTVSTSTLVSGLINNSASPFNGQMATGTGGTFTFGIDTVSGSNITPSNTGFTGSLSKGLTSLWSCSYICP